MRHFNDYGGKLGTVYPEVETGNEFWNEVTICFGDMSNQQRPQPYLIPTICTNFNPSPNFKSFLINKFLLPPTGIRHVNTGNKTSSVGQFLASMKLTGHCIIDRVHCYVHPGWTKDK